MSTTISGNVEPIRARARDWLRLADFLEAQPLLAEKANTLSFAVFCSVSLCEEPIRVIEEAARAATAAGASVKVHSTDRMGGIEAAFGEACLRVLADKALVFASQKIATVEYSPLFSIPSQGGEEKSV